MLHVIHSLERRVPGHGRMIRIVLVSALVLLLGAGVLLMSQ